MKKRFTETQIIGFLGKEILVTNTSGQRTTNMGAGNFDLTFRCLAKGDPDLQRPDYATPPTTVFEDRRRSSPRPGLHAR